MKRLSLLALVVIAFVVSSFGQKISERYWGFKGMVDAGGIIIPNHSAAGGELTGSVGFQFNRYLFLGGGVGCYKLSDEDDFFVPVYANIRINPLRPKVAPFADVRIGFIANDTEAAYVSAGGGVRWKNGKHPVTFGAYYSALFRGFYDGSAVGSHYDGLVLRLGLEF